jgi:hypothetical protein
MVCAKDVRNIIRLKQESGSLKVRISIFYIKNIGGSV